MIKNNGRHNYRSPVLKSNIPQPSLLLDFSNSLSLGPLVTFSRSTTATYTNSSGILTSANIDTSRFGYNPTTLQSLGLFLEESRTNILLNSLLNGTNLSTQTVTTTAVPYTLSFYGTGTIVLSGTNVSTQVGTGTYPSRKVFTFTPTAGSLILTVTGTVQYAQLEIGSSATSFIPTAGSQVVRGADLAAITGSNFTSWYNATEGTLLVTSIHANLSTRNSAFISDGTSSNRMGITTVAGAYETYRFQSSSGNYFASDNVICGDNIPSKIAISYKASNQNMAVNGRAVAVTSQAVIPTVNTLYIGADATGLNQLNGYVSTLTYYPQALTSTQLQTLTT
jgi:hypothetical protein